MHIKSVRSSNIVPHSKYHKMQMSQNCGQNALYFNSS